MIVKELVGKILKDFESLPKPLSVAENEEFIKNNIKFFMLPRQNGLSANERPPMMDHTEEDYKELLRFLETNRESKKEATSESLEPFITLLKNRWERIKGAPDDYVSAPDLVGNRAYLIVARHLADALNQNHPYCLLFPAIDTHNAHVSRGTLKDLHMHEFKFR